MLVQNFDVEPMHIKNLLYLPVNFSTVTYMYIRNFALMCVLNALIPVEQKKSHPFYIDLRSIFDSSTNFTSSAGRTLYIPPLIALMHNSCLWWFSVAFFRNVDVDVWFLTLNYKRLNTALFLNMTIPPFQRHL